jgi:hypothetical protein
MCEETAAVALGRNGWCPLHAPVDPSRRRWTHGRPWCSRILLDDSPRSSARPHPPRRWRGTPEQLASQLPPHPPVATRPRSRELRPPAHLRRYPVLALAADGASAASISHARAPSPATEGSTSTKPSVRRTLRRCPRTSRRRARGAVLHELDGGIGGG